MEHCKDDWGMIKRNASVDPREDDSTRKSVEAKAATHKYKILTIHKFKFFSIPMVNGWRVSKILVNSVCYFSWSSLFSSNWVSKLWCRNNSTWKLQSKSIPYWQWKIVKEPILKETQLEEDSNFYCWMSTCENSWKTKVVNSYTKCFNINLVEFVPSIKIMNIAM